MYRFYSYTVQGVPQLFMNRSIAEKFCAQHNIPVDNIKQLFEFAKPQYVEPGQEPSVPENSLIEIIQENDAMDNQDWIEP